MDRQQREEFAKRIRTAFAESGMTQPDLAFKSGVPLRTVHAVLRGERVPHEDNIIPLARALGIEVKPEDVREAWPKDVKLFLDTVGLVLMAMPEDERDHIMRTLTTCLVRGR